MVTNPECVLSIGSACSASGGVLSIAGVLNIAQINRRTIDQFRAGGPIDGMQRANLLLIDDDGGKDGPAPHSADDVRSGR